jgi:serine/threonine-protein kinase
VQLDAAPGVAARAIELQTPTPGLTAAIYAAQNPQPASAGAAAGSLSALGWTQLAAPRAVGPRTTIPLGSGGTRYRFYLIWITKLPPGSETAEISEATVFR